MEPWRIVVYYPDNREHHIEPDSEFYTVTEDSYREYTKGEEGLREILEKIEEVMEKVRKRYALSNRSEY